MATFTATISGLGTDPATFDTDNLLPVSGDSVVIPDVTVTYGNQVQLNGLNLVFGGSAASTLAFQNADATAASFVATLSNGTNVTAAFPNETDTILFAGELANTGTISATANAGTFVIDGRALGLNTGTIGAVFANTGSVVVANGTTMTVNLSGNTDFSGAAVTAATTDAPELQNGGTFSVNGGTLNVQGNVSTIGGPSGVVPGFNISGAGRLQLAGSVDAGQTVNFGATASTGNNTLVLNAPASYAGKITGYGSVGDTIDFSGQVLTGASYQNGVLATQATSGGATVTADSITANLSGATGVQFSSDGNGGTNMLSVYNNAGSTLSNISALRNNVTLTAATGAAPTMSQTVTNSGVTTTYVNSNQVNFADGTEYYSAASTGGQADLLYSALLQRTPDAAGLGFYATELQNGMTATQVAQGFISSAEYQAAFGSQSSSDFVGNLYTSLLGRSADADGLSYWSGQIDSNTLTRAQVAASFITTPEVQAVQDAAGSSSGLANGVFGANQAAVQVANDYQTVLGRLADQDGLGFWTQQLETGVSSRDLLNSFIGSAEFQANASVQTNAGFVTQIQTNTEGSSDASGLAYWTAQLDSGAASRADVASAYANSTSLAIRQGSVITDHGILTAGQTMSA